MREKLIEFLMDKPFGRATEEEETEHIEDVTDYLIDNGVTIPVRCKDCKHWHEETGWCNQHSHFWDERGGFCHPWESCDWKMFDEDDFCSYGERRTDD